MQKRGWQLLITSVVPRSVGPAACPGPIVITRARTCGEVSFFDVRGRFDADKHSWSLVVGAIIMPCEACLLMRRPAAAAIPYQHGASPWFQASTVLMDITAGCGLAGWRVSGASRILYFYAHICGFDVSGNRICVIGVSFAVSFLLKPMKRLANHVFRTTDDDVAGSLSLRPSRSGDDCMCRWVCRFRPVQFYPSSCLHWPK